LAIKVRTKDELEKILRDPSRYHEGMGIWMEDIIIRAYLDKPDWQTLYREDSPLHSGFDFITKNVTTGKVVIAEMKMSNKTGRLRTYLKKTKNKGRQMSLQWIMKTAQEISESHPTTYMEIINAINNNLLERKLYVTNHVRRPHGWLPVSYGTMGMTQFTEIDFRKTPGFD
jgi:hypothetical protein